MVKAFFWYNTDICTSKQQNDISLSHRSPTSPSLFQPISMVQWSYFLCQCCIKLHLDCSSIRSTEAMVIKLHRGIVYGFSYTSFVTVPAFNQFSGFSGQTSCVSLLINLQLDSFHGQSTSNMVTELYKGIVFGFGYTSYM